MSRRSGRTPKSPAFQAYPSDFLSDLKCTAMSAEEIGCYWLLICHGWIEGSLPNDHDLLARLARLPTKRFQKAWVLVGQCFHTREDGRLVNPRQERERKFQAENRERLKALSDAGVAARKGQSGNSTVAANGQCGAQYGDLPNPVSLIPTPGVCDAHAHAREAPPWGAALADRPAFDTPEVRAALERWDRHTRERGKPVTATAWAALISSWVQWGPAQTVRNIDASIRSNHGTVFEHEHDGKAPPPAKAVPAPKEPADAGDVSRRWHAKHAIVVETEVRGIGKVRAPGVDGEYPGYAAAKRELDGAVTP